MPKCPNCDVKVSLFAVSDFCEDCCEANEIEKERRFAEQNQVLESEQVEALARTARVEAIMLTTETAPNLNIIKRIEIVTAECAFGMNMFKDLFAGVRNVVGGRSKAVQDTMRESRKTVLHELKKEAYEVGANAVVGVDLDYVELSNAGSMVMLVASGTAVIIGE
jgi:uncharacterized protein YbjQ (UPF0145 family)